MVGAKQGYSQRRRARPPPRAAAPPRRRPGYATILHRARKFYVPLFFMTFEYHAPADCRWWPPPLFLFTPRSSFSLDSASSHQSYFLCHCRLPCCRDEAPAEDAQRGGGEEGPANILLFCCCLALGRLYFVVIIIIIVIGLLLLPLFLMWLRSSSYS